MEHRPENARTAATAPREVASVRGRHEALGRAGRVGVAAALLWAAWTAVEEMDRLRHAEAWLGAHVVAAVMGRSYHPSGSALVHYPVGPLTTRALEITWQCSVVWAMVPVLAMAAGLVLVPGTSWWRVVVAAAIGVVVVGVVNQLRLLVIALATAWWGRDGFEVSHRLVGSGLVLLSVAVALSFVWRSTPRQTSGTANRVKGRAREG
jgi:exosortase/archaeosortase family protein